MRTLKGLLLQMKLGTSDERILAEEEIIKLFDDEKSRSKKLVEALDKITGQGTMNQMFIIADDALRDYSTDSGDGAG